MLGYVTHETEGIIFPSVHQKILKLLTIEREFVSTTTRRWIALTTLNQGRGGKSLREKHTTNLRIIC